MKRGREYKASNYSPHTDVAVVLAADTPCFFVNTHGQVVAGVALAVGPELLSSSALWVEGVAHHAAERVPDFADWFDGESAASPPPSLSVSSPSHPSPPSPSASSSPCWLAVSTARSSTVPLPRDTSSCWLKDGTLDPLCCPAPSTTGR